MRRPRAPRYRRGAEVRPRPPRARWAFQPEIRPAKASGSGRPAPKNVFTPCAERPIERAPASGDSLNPRSPCPLHRQERRSEALSRRRTGAAPLGPNRVAGAIGSRRRSASRDGRTLRCPTDGHRSSREGPRLQTARRKNRTSPDQPAPPHAQNMLSPRDLASAAPRGSADSRHHASFHFRDRLRGREPFQTFWSERHRSELSPARERRRQVA